MKPVMWSKKKPQQAGGLHLSGPLMSDAGIITGNDYRGLNKYRHW